MRTGEAHGLFTGRGDENLAPARELVGERLAEGVERAPVDFGLPDDRVDAVVRVDVPAVTETGGAPDGDVRVRADPARRMRLLHRLGRARSALEIGRASCRARVCQYV